MSDKNLVIINNEKVSKKNFSPKSSFYCDNIDMKTIPEDLGKVFNLTFVARNSKIERFHQINLERIEVSSNIFTFLLSIFKTFKKDKTSYLIISITPYTFFSYLILFFFRKKVFVYLRSNGYEEYKAIFRFIGPGIYHLMFKIVTSKANIITCQERLFPKEKSDIVFPSELNSTWLENIKKPPLEKPKLLYIGRIKIEKGIFSLLKILNEIFIDFQFSIVGGHSFKWPSDVASNKKFTIHPFANKASSLINFYDNHNIFILPSFTEAHPKVIDESLARLRPVIIFEEIKHIIGDRKGIFVSKRDKKSLTETIDSIMKNYSNIQEDMKKNKLPTKKEFILQMINILNSN